MKAEETTSSDGGSTTALVDAVDVSPRELADTAIEALFHLLDEGSGFSSDSVGSSAVSEGFSTTSILSYGALLEAVAQRPAWLSQRERDGFARSLDPLLRADPRQVDAEDLGFKGTTGLDLFRQAVYVTALRRLCYWKPRSAELDREERTIVKEARSQAGRRLKEQAALYIHALQEAQNEERLDSVHPFLSCAYLQALADIRQHPWTETEHEDEDQDEPSDPGHRPDGATGTEGSAVGEPATTTDKGKPAAETGSDIEPTSADPRGTASGQPETTTDEEAEATEDADGRPTDPTNESEIDKPDPGEDGGSDLVATASFLMNEFGSRLDERIEGLLAHHQLEMDNASECAALAFAASAAAKARRSPHAQAALKAALAAHKRTRGLEQPTVVPHHDEQGGKLTVPGLEALAAVVEAVEGSVEENEFLSRPDAVAAPQAAFAAVRDGLASAKAARVEFAGEDQPDGWTSEQVLDAERIEAWATSVVLRLALAADKLDHRAARQRVLMDLDAKPTAGEDWPSWLHWDEYKWTADPERSLGVLDFMDEEIVQPRTREPEKSRSQAAIVLLFGPPGTTKTTIARAVAGGLEWPLVTLSPGNFIQEGLEKVEKRAKEVFDQLEQLSRAVVIFDECDELFRRRAPDPSTEPFRNVSAFITASMLPKLQDLHDRGRVVVFICTNFLTSIDPAMRRVGRVDHLIAVSPPDETQRLATIRRELGEQKEEAIPHLNEAVEHLAELTENFIRGEIVSAARELDEIESFEGPEHAREEATSIAGRTVRTIDTESEDFKQFLSDREKLSAPHRKAKQRR